MPRFYEILLNPQMFISITFLLIPRRVHLLLDLLDMITPRLDTSLIIWFKLLLPAWIKMQYWIMELSYAKSTLLYHGTVLNLPVK